MSEAVEERVVPATVVIRARAGDSAITLTLGQRLAGDGELAVTLTGQGFTGRQDVWFQAYELGRFATELRYFEAARRGPVNLQSMSPEKFMLDFRPFTKRDQAIVVARLQRHAFWGDPRFAQSLQVAFEWDRAHLPDLIGQVDALVAAMKGTPDG